MYGDMMVDALIEENDRLQKWVDDLQSGMYINCVYCGHNYGPEDEVPATMAEVLKEHVEQCPKHPMSQLKAQNEKLKELASFYRSVIQSGETWTPTCAKIYEEAMK
jgi:hypothetical protein